MDVILRYMSERVLIPIFCLIGTTLLVIGIVAAATGWRLAGFTPEVWLLLALIFVVRAFIVTVAQILRRIEAWHDMTRRQASDSAGASVELAQTRSEGEGSE
jgi:membrane protein implicated in regulation of membrane protease activity